MNAYDAKECGLKVMFSVNSKSEKNETAGGGNAKGKA